jgi:hypothetical protein
MSGVFIGDVLPDVVVEEGEGYRLELSMGLGGEGEFERTESGEERGEEGGRCCCGDSMTANLGLL